MRPNNDARVDLKRRMIVLTGTRCTYCELKMTHKTFCMVIYAFPLFIKLHGFMILTGTTKIGIQQIKLSIHMIREILQNFNYCILHIYKFVTCIFDHFIITSSEERERDIVFNATFNNISGEVWGKGAVT
jgi:hypothetical protein